MMCRRVSGLRAACAVLITLGILPTAARAQGTAADPSALEFFEKEVRPLLAARCQGCHGPKKHKGDLRLDSLEAVLTGGSTGPAIVPGKPRESLLIDAINYGELYQMPPKSKLPAQEIATLTRWVELGAPWPKHDAPLPSQAAANGFNLEERARHWSLQPVRAVAPPAVRRSDWPRTPIDSFILARLEAKGLAPAPEADKRTLIRRLTYDLIGLPPTPEESAAFLADESPHAYENLVERLLASPRYGERWARHWLDLVRYAETAGHEFDYNTPGASLYRDYVVRALNADLPYNQFVIEHLAGDLLEHPRRHPTEGFNESILGTGFFLLGEGTHSPVDVRGDEAARVDNQLDVLSKTFLAMTVACARCHDHKFDAITQKDYYALAGYLQSSRHQHAAIDPPGRITEKVVRLRQLKQEIAQGVEWTPPAASETPSTEAGSDKSIRFAKFDGPTFGDWMVAGDAFGEGPTRAGDFLLRAEGPALRARFVAPGLAQSGLVSERLQGVLRSPTFTIEKKFIHYLAGGRKGRINVIVDGYEKIRDPIYGVLTIEINSGDQLQWHSQNVGMWVGHKAYLEFCDGAAANYSGGQTAYFDGSGFLAVDEVRFADNGPPAAGPRPLFVASADLGNVSSSLLESYRSIEAAIPAPTFALALTDGTAEDERLHIRGSHVTLGEVVPRRFLEVLGGTQQPAPERGSGRLELARRVVDPSSPLVGRVLVNRLWKHHFGSGIVPTPDDFGHMGQPPSHPELLDYLAARFVSDGWSLKQMHRLMVESSTYRMQSHPEPSAERLDPTNQLLHRMNVHRLEAEALRDAILAVSGRLDRAMFGQSVPPHLTPFMEGRGRPGVSGPLDGDGRRSLYLGVRRNFLNPMFLAFDTPAPFSTMGRRNVSNVPAQALILMNDPFVISQARRWADRVLREPNVSPRDRLNRMYLAAYGRPATDAEADTDLAFLGQSDDPRAWADLGHVLLNVKEFIYIE